MRDNQLVFYPRPTARLGVAITTIRSAFRLRLFEYGCPRMMVTHWPSGRRRCSQYRGAASTSTPGWFIKETNAGFMRSIALGDQDAPLHPTEQKHGSDVLFCPQRSCRRSFQSQHHLFGLANNPPRERTVLMTFSKGSRLSLLAGPARSSSVRHGKFGDRVTAHRNDCRLCPVVNPIITVEIRVVLPAPLGLKQGRNLALTECSATRLSAPRNPSC